MQTTFQIIVLFVTHLGLPLYFFYTVWRARDKSKFGWLLKVLTGGVVFTYLFIAGRWDWFSIYLRYIFVAVYLVLVVYSAFRIKERPLFVKDGQSVLWQHKWSLLELFLFSGFVVYTATGLFYSGEPVRLETPLEDGRFYVGQGGNSPILNAHNTNEAQQYALDITEVNQIGVRATGIYPSELDRYVIFGETIYSPCNATVVEALDGLPDLIPPERDSENPAGNHVVLACKDVRLLLAHMKNGSVLVQTGETVDVGQQLGQVGNSGNTTEPHLHIHAVEPGASIMEGHGVPILIEDSFPVRNSLLSG